MARTTRFFLFFLILLALLAGGAALDLQGRWRSEDGTPIPEHFRVLVYDSTNDRVDTEPLNRLDQSIVRLEESGSEISYLLPVDAESKYRFEDTDTFFEVNRLSDREQIVRLSYELGIGNHGWSRYRATATGVTPIEAQEGDGFFVGLAFAATLLIAIVYVVLRVMVAIFRGLGALFR